MRYLVKERKNILNVLMILSLPIIIKVFSIVTMTIFNIGTYTGTFLRYLYHIVVS